MVGLQYAQPVLEIAVGTTIEWKNEDPVAHTVTADDNGFDSGLIESGQVWRYTFTRPGTYAYHCTPHPFMKGTVVVK
ncbi:MAG: cupredoxin family copper-binding protein [Gemmatimonadetes bacterium]|nr:cupredoxin family copper-binding protein [Gemmatimonadota bacterium]